MLILISPAKTLDFDTPPVTEVRSEPRFLDDSRALVKTLRERSPADLASLMKISDTLAELNHRRFAEWQTPFTPANAKQAVLAFRGDVYTGLEADGWGKRDFAFAQDHLRILSGLYGVLRPLDLIQPYRLEMGTSLPNERGRDLYAYWRETITATLAEELAGQRSPVTVNLASNEYFGSVDPAGLPGRVVTPVFRDLKNGRYKIISFYAKKARGLMAAWIIRNRIKRATQLRDFDLAGYAYDADASAAEGPDALVFHRQTPI
ncbi:MAG TPA: peroxide stress protein YaaA [Pseudomonadales bacterium]|nr:peroxide stress protein YaaA [Pseudomonadales bacterium]